MHEAVIVIEPEESYVLFDDKEVLFEGKTWMETESILEIGGEG